MTRSNRIDWKAATWAGIIAGFVFLVLEMVMVTVFGGGSPWGPPRMMAAIVLGKGVLPPPATFAPGVVAVAMAVHFVLAIVYALVFSLVITRVGLGPALALGGLGGSLLYIVNFYGFTALFPWFAMARNWITVFTHIVFGVTVAAAYVPARRHHFHEGKSGGTSFRERKA